MKFRRKLSFSAYGRILWPLFHADTNIFTGAQKDGRIYSQITTTHTHVDTAISSVHLWQIATKPERLYPPSLWTILVNIGSC